MRIEFAFGRDHRCPHGMHILANLIGSHNYVDPPTEVDSNPDRDDLGRSMPNRSKMARSFWMFDDTRALLNLWGDENVQQNNWYIFEYHPLHQQPVETCT